jgi:hypothetical protein
MGGPGSTQNAKISPAKNMISPPIKKTVATIAGAGRPHPSPSRGEGDTGGWPLVGRARGGCGDAATYCWRSRATLPTITWPPEAIA